MQEEKVPKNELALYLETLESALTDVVASVSNGKVELIGLPVEEWAGPGYAVAALFDPYVLSSNLKGSKIYLEFPDGADIPAGIKSFEKRNSRKEPISFVAGGGRTVELHLPMIWGGVLWNRIKASAEWKPIGKIAEYPAALAKDGTAVFAFNPLKVIHRYMNMAEPATTAGLTDFMIRAILGASGLGPELDENDLRRDFHAFGISVLMLDQMHRAVGRDWDVANVLPGLHEAADLYMQGEFPDAEERLRSLFRQLESRRREIVSAPIYLMMMPHGGILFEEEGYAEYDSPEMAARALNLYLDWSEKFGFRFAPDIGAGTLEEFAKLQPETVSRLRAAWEDGAIEFVNGTYSQPYLQLWHRWDQEKQFEIGFKAFNQLFGRRPEVYAAQEIALHPALPAILNKYGFKHAIHRSQNLGLAPIDNSPLINWQSPDGASIRALPSHPLRSELRGGSIWRHLPVLLTSDRNGDLPFIALTSLMDQSFIDIYAEEIVRTHHYAPVWGQFVRPSDFFEKTSDLPAEDTCYSLDQYHYALDLTENAMSHEHQTGGYSSEHAFIFSEGARLQKLEAEGKLTEADLKKLLNQEAHDSYIIPYFAPGYFMEGGLTDYNGPKYRYCTDLPRGTDRFIRDAAGYPESFSDRAPAMPEACVIDDTRMSCGEHNVHIDPDTGSVLGFDGISCALGALEYEGATFRVENVSSVADRMILKGRLPGFGQVRLEYFINGGMLYCAVIVVEQEASWSSDEACWDDCAYLCHAKSVDTQVIRTVSGISQPTGLKRFHSLGKLELRGDRDSINLRHGGNIFFRQTGTAVHNRLWCYDEFCDRFWWGVELKTDKKEELYYV
jgi:hypothetical protein